jgi:hypothetical protein
MLTERTLQLINAELDGELGPGEREELDALLEASADARAMRAELQKLDNLMDAVPSLTPPPQLGERILDRLALPQRRFGFDISGMFANFQPATAGLAFAAGLLATVAVYEWAPSAHSPMSTSGMVGTMVAGQQIDAMTPLDSYTISQPGMKGTLRLVGSDKLLALEVDVDSARSSEIEIILDDAGVVFGGIALGAGGQGQKSEVYEVSGGTVRVVNQGRQTFTLFLPISAREGSNGRHIRFGISAEEAPGISGVLRG